MLDGNRASAGGVTVDGDDRQFGHDGVPLHTAKRQFNDLDAPVRTWRLGASHYRESAGGGVELLAVSGDGTGRWTDYTGAYFASADEMSVADEPGEPGPGTKVREAWAVKHAEMLRDEAFAQATDDSATGREHTLLSERQQLRADGAIGLAPITVGGVRQVLADQDSREDLDNQTRKARRHEARLEYLQGLREPETGTREAVLHRLQISHIKEKIAEFGEAVGRKLPEDVGVADLTDEDLTAIYGPLDEWQREPVTNGTHDETEQIGA